MEAVVARKMLRSVENAKKLSTAIFIVSQEPVEAPLSILLTNLKNETSISIPLIWEEFSCTDNGKIPWN